MQERAVRGADEFRRRVRAIEANLRSLLSTLADLLRRMLRETDAIARLRTNRLGVAMERISHENAALLFNRLNDEFTSLHGAPFRMTTARAAGDATADRFLRCATEQLSTERRAAHRASTHDAGFIAIDRG